MKKNQPQSINLGEIQSKFVTASKTYSAAERALKRAQDTRDSAKSSFEAAETSLREASRTVLG